MSNEPPIVQLGICQQCGALCDTQRSQCWMCQAPAQKNAYQPVDLSNAVAESESTYDPLFYALLAICALLAVLVGVGLAVEDSGALIPYVIVIGPAFTVTGVRALWQYSGAGRFQPGKLLVSFALSIAITIGIIILLVAAGIVLLFIMCLQAITA